MRGTEVHSDKTIARKRAFCEKKIPGRWVIRSPGIPWIARPGTIQTVGRHDRFTYPYALPILYAINLIENTVLVIDINLTLH